MSFFEEMDEFISKLPLCEIILDDEFVSEPGPNRAFIICPRCGNSICDYHSELGHEENLK